MKYLSGGLIAGLSLASCVVVFPSRALAASASAADGTPQLLTELKFSSAVPLTSGSLGTSEVPSGWVIGAQDGGAIGVQQTSGPDGAAVLALEGSYPQPNASGAQYMWADYSVASLNTEDLYIEFWAKMPSQYKGGFKFLKIFGQSSDATGVADTTIGTDYTQDYGQIPQISFGDGTSLLNDCQNVINLDGTYPTWIGRSYGTAVVQTPQDSVFPSTAWGTAWHHFRIHVKFNSGTTSQNEVPNGEYYLEIDGKVYADATGLYNRNPANGPINYVEFFGWAQADPEPFQVWYDDIQISTGGFMSTPLPSPPANVGVK